ncbi:hypothetical protein [Sulfobacillus harzensis]|uniref:Uncharacterized protein n=1 Tax=Sulfobacillus harzensis TaxID=2729629 RepID=A0A7Y0L1R5_9FIRM|nr:hypothetical protein [Sulfobacillus harzensis]NMP21704.1 hypothetical protein [Sulfobacillus harzensis]
MGYRITIHMALADGAEARLWAIVSQRRADVSRATFEKNRVDAHIHATLEVETDHQGARKLMRHLARHQDIRAMTLELPESAGRLGQGPVTLTGRRVRMTPAKKGASV